MPSTLDSPQTNRNLQAAANVLRAGPAKPHNTLTKIFRQRIRHGKSPPHPVNHFSADLKTQIRVKLTARGSSVLVVRAPMATGTRPPASSITMVATRTRSSKLMVEKSPAAPPARKVALSAFRQDSMRNRTYLRSVFSLTGNPSLSSKGVGTVT